MLLSTDTMKLLRPTVFPFCLVFQQQGSHRPQTPPPCCNLGSYLRPTLQLQVVSTVRCLQRAFLRDKPNTACEPHCLSLVATSSSLSLCENIWRHPQNRKYARITTLPEEDWATAISSLTSTKNWRRLNVLFRRYDRGQTNSHTHTHSHALTRPHTHTHARTHARTHDSKVECAVRANKTTIRLYKTTFLSIWNYGK